MPSRKEQHLPPNLARRHFLGLAAATGAKVAVIGAAAASLIPPRWPRPWADGGGRRMVVTAGILREDNRCVF